MLPNYHEGIYRDQFTGVLLGVFDQNDVSKTLRTWQLSNGKFLLPVVIPSEALLDGLLSQPLTVHEFSLLDWTGRTKDIGVIPAVVINTEWRGRLNALEFLQPSVCPIKSVFADTLALVDDLQTEPLRRLIRSVFLDREVQARYWTMPASARHHHAHAGGLAEHSLEVAQDIATQAQLTGIERDLGIVGGLLHDIGKVWAYTDNMFPNIAGQAMGHELIGLARMEQHLQVLEASWPDGAYAMRVLLSGCARPRADGSLPSALVARIRACDQRSCERNQGHPTRKARSWIPKPWQPSTMPTGLE